MLIFLFSAGVSLKFPPARPPQGTTRMSSTTQKIYFLIKIVQNLIKNTQNIGCSSPSYTQELVKLIYLCKFVVEWKIKISYR